MHIIYLLPKQTYFTEGRRGRVTHAVGVARGLAACGVRVTVVSGPGTREAVQHDDIHCVEVAATGSGASGDYRWTTQALAALQGEIHRQPVDAVIVRYAVSNAFRFARFFKRVSACLTCFEVNSLAYHQYHGLPGLVRRAFLFLERRVLRCADMNTVVSSKLASDIAVNERDAQRIVTVPNAADPHATRTTQPSPEADEPAAPVKLVYMGVFQPYYELDLVVQAYLMIRQRGVDAQLHLYGDGPQYDSIKKLADGHDAVHLHGRYDLAELLNSGVLDDRTVLLLPNRGSGMSEIGSPIKFYEYMSLGKAILASRVGQAVEVLEHEQTCLFYEPGDVDSCAAAMERLVREPALRNKLAQGGLAGFLSGHTWQARMGQLRSEIERLANNEN